LDNKLFWNGVRDCIPTLLGYLSIGFASGIIGQSAGLSVAEICLLSTLVYAGSAQFIFAGMIGSSHSLAGIVITIFFVNLRHLLLSAALSPYFRALTPAKNMLIGSLLTDETFGVASTHAARTGRIHPAWMHGLNLAAYLNWIAANVAGAFLGRWITEPERFGLDFALPAMFIGLLVLQMVSRRKYRTDMAVALCAAAAGIAGEFLFDRSISIIAATVTAATAGVVFDRWK
jgi:4-azaleucine resistance transporter AzlC